MASSVPFPGIDKLELHPKRVPFYMPPDWVYPDMSTAYRKSYSEYTAFFNSVWKEQIKDRLTIHTFRHQQVLELDPTDKQRGKILDEVYKYQWKWYLGDYERKGAGAKHDMRRMWDDSVGRLEAEIWMALRRKYLWNDIRKAKNEVNELLSKENSQRRQVEQLHDILENPSASSLALDEAANRLYWQLKTGPFIVDGDRWNEKPTVSQLVLDIRAALKM